MILGAVKRSEVMSARRTVSYCDPNSYSYPDPGS